MPPVLISYSELIIKKYIQISMLSFSQTIGLLIAPFIRNSLTKSSDLSGSIISYLENLIDFKHPNRIPNYLS